jgi:hypothetical protein
MKKTFTIHMRDKKVVNVEGLKPDQAFDAVNDLFYQEDARSYYETVAKLVDEDGPLALLIIDGEIVDTSCCYPEFELVINQLPSYSRVAA